MQTHSYTYYLEKVQLEVSIILDPRPGDVSSSQPQFSIPVMGSNGQEPMCHSSVVNYAGDVIYDKYIMPEMPIFDYRTRWSGITQQDMKEAIPFIIARKEITAILKDKLVIGHALHHDFQVLKYFHPSIQTRDTSKMPLLNRKAGLPVKATVSLKTLALQLLHKRIQVGKEGHSSVEDAFAAMELYRLIEDQWEQDIMGNFPCQAAVETSDNEEFMEDKYWPEELNGNYTQR
ncbi:apoptosis-enhancing nuclease-like [Ambystoma mexicanum]|uniref:apoptosis-enhancing nuclease-like n=1 Tax=Ambystoma mexicanum TaxID=8296 RepID=UPI0037E898C1